MTSRWGWVAVCVLGLSGGGANPEGQPSGIGGDGPKPKLTRTQGSTPFDTVRCGLRDRAGNLWFGTTGEGVYRYDRDGFTQYTTRDGLSSNRVWCLLEDRGGRIWIGTDSGLCRWDGTAFRSLPLPLPGASVPGGSRAILPVLDLAPAAKLAVWSLLEARNGTVWVGTSGGMLCCQDDVFTPFPDNARVRNLAGVRLKMVESMLEDRHGNIWFASGMPPGSEGLCRFDGTFLTQFKPGGALWIRSLVEGRDGDLWLGTRSQGAWRYDGTTFTRYDPRPGLLTPRLVDRSGNVWFGELERRDDLPIETVIGRYDGTTFQSFAAKDGIGPLEAWCIVEGRDGHLWVGTRNTGLYRYDGTSFVRLSE